MKVRDQMSKHYKSDIRIEDDVLFIAVEYEYTVTKEQEEGLRDYFQWRFSRKAGRPVLRSEIHVKPREGDTARAETSFVVESGKSLYPGLAELYHTAPYAFPLLIGELERYRRHPDLTEYEEELISYAIGSLHATAEHAKIHGPPTKGETKRFAVANEGIKQLDDKDFE